MQIRIRTHKQRLITCSISTKRIFLSCFECEALDYVYAFIKQMRQQQKDKKNIGGEQRKLSCSLFVVATVYWDVQDNNPRRFRFSFIRHSIYNEL